MAPSSTQAEAVAADRLLREIVESSPFVAIRWRLEPGWPIEYASANIARFGISAQAVSSGAISLWDLVNPDDYAAAEAGWAAPGETPAVYRTLEYTLRDCGPIPRLLRFHVRTRKDARGAYCEGYLTEAADSLQHQQKLRLLELAVNTSHNGVVIVDARLPDMPVIFANRAVEAITGYLPEEFIGRNCRFLHGDDADQPGLGEMRQALRRKVTCDTVVRNYRKDGRAFWNEIRISPVTNAAGEVTHFIGVQADITPRREAEQRVERSLREKEVLLKEIHHRVKNNMQIISSLLSLQLEHITSAETRDLFLQSQNRIASMALVHEKLYQSNDLARIDFADYVRELTDNVVGSQVGAAPVQFCLEAGPVHLGIDTAIPCGLLINELVSNAYKHAFAPGTGGTITVRLHATADGLLLEVQDNGKGIPAGVDLRSTGSLGMQLVFTLVQQLRGSLEVSGPPGTLFRLQLHEAPPSRLRP